MKLGSLETHEAKDDLHSVDRLLGGEEDNALGLEGALAERNQHCVAVFFVMLADSDELLDQVRGQVSALVHKEAYRVVEGKANQLVNLIGHRSGEQHGLPAARAVPHNLCQCLPEPLLEHSVVIRRTEKLVEATKERTKKAKPACQPRRGPKFRWNQGQKRAS